MEQKKKTIYMLQVNYPYGNTAHLPYTAGALVSYAMNDPRIESAFILKKIFFLREDPLSILDRIKAPDVIGFCSYIWNFEYNKYIAKEIKKRYPACVIVFGGHHIRPGGSLLEECPYIDYLIHGEGEEAFRNLLLYTLGDAVLSEIKGISYRTADGIVTAPPAPALTENEIDYPSPYLKGYFDDILKENPDTVFMALIGWISGR